FGGLPLSALGALAAAAIAFAAVALPRLAVRPTVVIACAFVVVAGAKLATGALAPAEGLLASYWAAPQVPSATPPERSTDFGWLAGRATRIDRGLALAGEDFAVHFFNDASRFNFGPDIVPGRDQLP